MVATNATINRFFLIHPGYPVLIDVHPATGDDDPDDFRRMDCVRSHLILYYQFAGNRAMASLAGDIRERAVAKTRTPFALKDFRGVDHEQIARLKAAGIVNVEHMLDSRT